jgi:hypothetical protein
MGKTAFEKALRNAESLGWRPMPPPFKADLKIEMCHFSVGRHESFFALHSLMLSVKLTPYKLTGLTVSASL